jgi:hypothetical protein
MKIALYLSVFLAYALIFYYIFRCLRVQIVSENAITESPGKQVSILGGMAALSVLFQVSPVFLPIAGLLLSPFSSLPIAIGTLLYPKGALPMFLAASGIVSIVYWQEGVVFLFATGPLGIAAALAAMSSSQRWRKILVSGLILTSGILILTFIIGLPGMVEAFENLHVFTMVLVVFIFSLTYSWLWVHIVLILKKRLLQLLKPNVSLDNEDMTRNNSDT